MPQRCDRRQGCKGSGSERGQSSGSISNPPVVSTVFAWSHLSALHTPLCLSPPVAALGPRIMRSAPEQQLDSLHAHSRADTRAVGARIVARWGSIDGRRSMGVGRWASVDGLLARPRLGRRVTPHILRPSTEMDAACRRRRGAGKMKARPTRCFFPATSPYLSTNSTLAAPSFPSLCPHVGPSLAPADAVCD